MSDGDSDGPSTAERIGRLQGIRSYVDDNDYSYLDLAGLYGSDPVATSPYIVPSTFIPEEIGGNVTVVDEDEERLATENLNQMLSNFLPGGYKQRWGNFDLWRGAWNHETEVGHADIDPMFEWKESFPLTDLLGDISKIEYTELQFDPEEVQVYVPLTIKVSKEDKHDTQYVWIPDKGIVWTGSPPMTTEPLSSDPTTNYLWFKHVLEAVDGESEPIGDDGIVEVLTFEDEKEFVRCYYASLLTLYPKESTKTKSGLIRYRSEANDKTAFVASKERSQLLTFGLDHSRIQSRIETVLEANSDLQRDLRFAYLRSMVWERLFFEDRELDHTFAVEPLIEHLLGIDYWRRVVDEADMGVFSLSGTAIVEEIERLLPEDSDRHLRLLGHENRAVSEVFETVEDNPVTMAELLARCRNDKFLQEFAERIVVHSAEHALSTWSNDLTGSGTSFELWYDVNFQEKDNEYAQIAVYDPIQGGAGIAKEVYETLRSDPNPEIEAGLARQGCCHSATADRATIEVLASYPNGSLYEIYEREPDEFTSIVEDHLAGLIQNPGAFSYPDLVANVKQRVRTLFETRELASFYSYVAEEYTTVEEYIGRMPRVVDLALHLERHVFTDPQIKTTYERFADDSGRRDIAELGERLEGLTVHCVTACPDCLKTEPGLCLHGTGQQETKLNRRLLTAVFDS
jgi:hypothetical protein